MNLFNTTINLSFLYCSFIIFVISCNDDYLQKEPIDRPSVSTFLQTEDELKLAVNGVYEVLWHSINYGIPVEVHLDLASDIGWSRAFTDFQFLGNGSVDASNPVILAIWRQFYNGIQRANYVLDNAPNIQSINNQELYDQLLAETRFLRVYFYYHLTQMFGNVPLVTNVLNVEESYMMREDKSEIVDFMLSELEQIIDFVPQSYSAEENKGRVSKGIILGLHSRIALFNERWEQAIQSAKLVMGLGYQLDGQYGDLYLKEGQSNSNEIMWLLDFKQGIKEHAAPLWIGSRMGNGYSGLIPTQSMIDSYLCIDGLPIDESPLFDPQKPFQMRDPRLELSVVVPGSTFHGFQYETHKDSLKCWNYNVSPAVRVDNQDVLNPYASFSGYCWRKYSDQRNPTYRTQSETGFILMRYAEILLNFAEAKIESGQIDQSVFEVMNQIRKRVNMPAIETGLSPDELRSILRVERKSELAFEGLRLYDIRRWRIAEEVLTGPLYGRIPDGILAEAPTIDENGTPNYNSVSNKGNMRIIEQREFDPNKNYLWPVPQFEVDINNEITQNLGY